MNPMDAIAAAVPYLSRLTPRGVLEEQELLHIIQALTSLSNSGKYLYANKNTITAS
jgi:hypothetical protein